MLSFRVSRAKLAANCEVPVCPRSARLVPREAKVRAGDVRRCESQEWMEESPHGKQGCASQLVEAGFQEKGRGLYRWSLT